MKKGNILEGNRKAWNQALGYHQKAFNGKLHKGFANPEFTTLNRDCDKMLQEKLKNIDLKGKTISHIPCNNGRELLSLMRLGAKEAIGFDISDEAIKEAKQLAEISKLNAEFVRTNALEISKEYDNKFDFIFISQGALQWFPDLNEFFGVISRLLKSDGRILIFEIHPLAYLFENEFSFQNPEIEKLVSYFEKGPHNYPKGLDYFGGVEYESSECFWFLHKMSDIISAIIKNKIQIQEFEEYNIEMADNAELEGMEKIPLSYIITGVKQN